MSAIVKIIILVIALFLATAIYACCMVAHTADEDAERLYREYEKWKKTTKGDKQ